MYLVTDDSNISLEEAKARTEAYVMEVWSSWLAQLTFLYTPGPFHRDGTTHNRLDLSTAITSQENSPTDLLTGQPERGSLFPVYVKLTKPS